MPAKNQPYLPGSPLAVFISVCAVAPNQRNTNVTFWMISSQPKNDLQAWTIFLNLKQFLFGLCPITPVSIHQWENSPLNLTQIPTLYHPTPLAAYPPSAIYFHMLSYLHSVRKYHMDLKAWTSCGTRVWQSQDTEVALTSHHQCSWITLFLAVTKTRTSSHLRKGGFLLACSLRDSLPWRGSHGSTLWRQLLTLYPQPAAGERWMLGSSSPFPFHSAWTPCLGNSLYLELVFPPWVDLSGNALTDTQRCTSPMP